MNTNRILSFSALFLVLNLFLFAISGCQHGKSVSKTQAPPTKTAPRLVTDPREKEIQDQINVMQEQIGILTKRTETLAAFHGLQMGPKWVEKVHAARADASHPNERMRYLEATKALLARKLQSLRAEMKVYEEFEASDPAIPRP